MLLILTADQRFWKPDREILFLGEWCRRHSDAEAWKTRQYSVLPYHWDDREKFREDAIWLDAVCDVVLEKLTRALNVFHGTEHSERYWRILLGPWLQSFLGTLFDRYRSIVCAAESGLVTNVVIPSHPPANWPSPDTSHYVENIVEDDLNQFLYGRIIERFRFFPFETLPCEPPVSRAAPAVRRTGFSVGGIAKKLAMHWARTVSRQGSHVFVASYLRRRDLFRLQMKLGQLPAPDYFGNENLQLPHSKETREGIRALFATGFSSLGGERDFLELLEEFLPESIPRVFVEGYVELGNLAHRFFPRSPRTIFTANAHNQNESFKLWAAESQESGASLILSQHGGHTGTGRWCSAERHEIRISDRYFSWGWEGGPTVTPLPAGKLSKLRRVKSSSSGKILLVLNGFPRYFYRSYSIPVAGQSLSYLNDQVQFLAHLSREARDLVEVRPYPSDYGWNEVARLRELDPSLRIPKNVPSFTKHLRMSRLFVGTHNTTTYLEAFCANFPSVLFWDPRFWELRSEAESYFGELLEAEILFHDPGAAAKKVSEVFSDPIGWWGSKRVQAARKRFCGRFARRDSGWLTAWELGIRRPFPLSKDSVVGI